MSATPDDEHWTPDYQSRNGTSAGPRGMSIDRLVVLGYITAVSMPLIGLIMAVVVARRPPKTNSRHVVWIVAISIVASVLWYLVLTSGVLSSASTDY